MKGREIRRALHAGEFVYATSLVSGSPLWLKVLPGLGVDFVFIDSEHVPRDRISLAWMCQAYDALGIPPVVRIPCPDAYEACKVLDGGASGVISPYTETVEQARTVAGAARYRPLKGRRLSEALEDPRTMEDALRDYLEHCNADVILILNIESVPAIENLSAILRVPGIDAVLIGPHDLSCSLGIPEQYDHPRFDEAVRTIIGTAREHDVGAGIHYWQSVDQEIEWCRAGANLIMHSTDLHTASRQFTRDLDRIRNALGTGSSDSAPSSPAAI